MSKNSNTEIDPVTGQILDDELREELERAMCTLADYGHLIKTLRYNGSLSDVIDSLRVLVDGRDP